MATGLRLIAWVVVWLVGCVGEGGLRLRDVVLRRDDGPSADEQERQGLCLRAFGSRCAIKKCDFRLSGMGLFILFVMSLLWFVFGLVWRLGMGFFFEGWLLDLIFFVYISE